MASLSNDFADYLFTFLSVCLLFRVFQLWKPRECLQFCPFWWLSARVLCVWCLPSAGRPRQCVPTPTRVPSSWQDRHSTPPHCCCSPWPQQVTPLRCLNGLRRRFFSNLHVIVSVVFKLYTNFIWLNKWKWALFVINLVVAFWFVQFMVNPHLQKPFYVLLIYIPHRAAAF